MTRSLAVRALAITMSVNLLLFFLQLAIIDVNPAAAPNFFATEGGFSNTPLGELDSGNYTLNENASSQLPDDSDSVSESGSVFTDTWKTIKNWIAQKTGLNYLYAMLTAVPNFLKNVGLPNSFAWAIGALWYSIMFLAVIQFIRGDG